MQYCCYKITKLYTVSWYIEVQNNGRIEITICWRIFCIVGGSKFRKYRITELSRQFITELRTVPEENTSTYIFRT
jgi:hypothetical protein